MPSLVNIIIYLEKAFIIKQTNVLPYGHSFFLWADCYTTAKDNTLIDWDISFPFNQ